MTQSDFCRFFIMRHGQTEWNVKKVIQGHLDAPLTDVGKESAKILAVKLKNIHFDALFSSDLLRARQTAEIIALERKMAVETTKLLRERNFGMYEGKNLSIFTNELKYLVEKFEKLSDEEKYKHTYPTMESDEEVVSRIITFLREIALIYRGKNILIISHSAIISALLIHLGYINYSDNLTYYFSHDAYAILSSDGIEFHVEKVVTE